MNWKTLFHDWRGQLSWGRIVSFIGLCMAVAGNWTGMDLDHTKVWITVALGGYGSSKATEAIASIKNKIMPENGTDAQ